MIFQPASWNLPIRLCLIAILLLCFASLEAQDATSSTLQLLEEVHSDRIAKAQQPLIDLQTNYLAAVENYKNQAMAEGNLKNVVAAEETTTLVTNGNLPHTDTDNPTLNRLASIYLEHRVTTQIQLIPARIAAEKEHLTDLKAAVERFTKSGNIEEAKSIQAKAVEVEALIHSLSLSSTPPSQATKNQPFVNSINMQFVPAGTTGVLFSIWQTRVKDYQAYATATEKRVYTPDFPQDPNHPVVNVSYLHATAFCEWLTNSERAAGRIGPNAYYRLPNDAEWSDAARLPREPGNTPAEKNERIRDIYPWGRGMPPAKNTGNYHVDYNADNFEATAPVGSFPPNQFGLYDLGSNVWEWCNDYMDPKTMEERVTRGSSWSTSNESWLLLSARRGSKEDNANPYQGFRVVLDFRGN